MSIDEGAIAGPPPATGPQRLPPGTAVTLSAAGAVFVPRDQDCGHGVLAAGTSIALAWEQTASGAVLFAADLG